MPPSEGQEPRALTVEAQAIEGRKCAETAKVHPDLRIVYNLAYGVLADEAGRFPVTGNYTTRFSKTADLRVGRLALRTIPMTILPKCPQCNSEFTYEDGAMYVCPECAHEWAKEGIAEPAETGLAVRDAVGNVLQDGDSVTVIKDLKVKGSSFVVKVGTKVKNIRLVEGDHDIDCKIDGIGAMSLKSEFVKKV